jgi:NADH:ubiquinone reductase (H+-translocating)
MAAQRPKVVIVGAGFGGLETARALARAPVDVTLLDRHNYHCFQPLLYQVATAALSPADIAWPVRWVLSRQRNLTTLMAEVTGVDTEAKQVRAGPVTLPYDYLVLATGATHSYFGHDEWAAAAPGLKNIEDATSIRRRLLLAFERAELTEDAAERRRLLTFVIVGAGPTGVEIAGALAELARHTLRADFRRFDPRSARVVLIEAGPRILPTLPEDLAAYAHRVLERMRVEVMTGTRVTGCDADGVETEGGRIEASTIVWAAGVVASAAGRWIEAETDRSGRVEVAPDLSVPGRPEVFVIGDTAAARDANGRQVAGIAPAAKQMGRYVGRLIAARAAGRPQPKPFRYRHLGDLATIGRKSAVVRLDRVHLKGFVGWLFWSLAHVYFLIGVRNRLAVAFTWFWNYFTYQRGARLITAEEHADGKGGPALAGLPPPGTGAALIGAGGSPTSRARSPSG